MRTIRFLTQRPPQDDDPTQAKKPVQKVDRAPRRTRKTRTYSPAWQRACQRKDFFAPVH